MMGSTIVIAQWLMDGRCEELVLLMSEETVTMDSIPVDQLVHVFSLKHTCPYTPAFNGVH